MPPKTLDQIVVDICAQVPLSVRTILPGPIAPRPHRDPLRSRPPCPVHPQEISTRYRVCQVCASQVVRSLRRFQSDGTIPKKDTAARDALLHLDATGLQWGWNSVLETLRGVIRGERVLTCGGCGKPALPGVACPTCSGGGTEVTGDASALLCDGCGSAANPRVLTLTEMDGAVCPCCVADVAELGRAA